MFTKKKSDITQVADFIKHFNIQWDSEPYEMNNGQTVRHFKFSFVNDGLVWPKNLDGGLVFFDKSNEDQIVGALPNISQLVFIHTLPSGQIILGHNRHGNSIIQVYSPDWGPLIQEMERAATEHRDFLSKLHIPGDTRAREWDRRLLQNRELFNPSEQHMYMFKYFRPRYLSEGVDQTFRIPLAGRASHFFYYPGKMSYGCLLSPDELAIAGTAGKDSIQVFSLPNLFKHEGTPCEPDGVTPSNKDILTWETKQTQPITSDEDLIKACEGRPKPLDAKEIPPKAQPAPSHSQSSDVKDAAPPTAAQPTPSHSQSSDLKDAPSKAPEPEPPKGPKGRTP